MAKIKSKTAGYQRQFIRGQTGKGTPTISKYLTNQSVTEQGREVHKAFTLDRLLVSFGKKKVKK